MYTDYDRKKSVSSLFPVCFKSVSYSAVSSCLPTGIRLSDETLAADIDRGRGSSQNARDTSLPDICGELVFNS